MEITSFRGEHRFLSNFWPCEVDLDGFKYPSVEHAYQAAKTLDNEERQQIWEAEKAGQAKRLGRGVTLRPDWEEIKISTMEDLVRQKFGDPTLRKLLAETGEALLIEGNNWHDNFWGSCRCSRCSTSDKERNRLGLILMVVREEIKPLEERRCKRS